MCDLILRQDGNQFMVAELETFTDIQNSKAWFGKTVQEAYDMYMLDKYIEKMKEAAGG